jgi:pimeloyl-ACP methyl ester carboxylesterase
VATGAAAIEPFPLHVEEADLEALRRRLRETRWPAAETVADWSQGVPSAYLRELAEYWAEEYDWRRCEERLNATGGFRTEIDGTAIYFLHARSPHPGATPLLITHGWPGSVREYLDLVEPLTNPADHAAAFDVVIPALPGFGFSPQPPDLGWNVQRIAAAWAELMARLGYERYGAHGGDWGAAITNRIGAVDAEHVIGIHTTIPLIDLEPDIEGLELNDFERAGIERGKAFAAAGMGYLQIQATRPQTLGYGLADSPAGQLAWILDKLWAWSDCDGDPANAFTRDAMLDNVMHYWLPDAGASSARIYWEAFQDLPDDVVEVPAGCSLFPKEHVRVPRGRAEQKLLDVRHWREFEKGGHFAAFEQPEVMVEELRTFFGALR